MIRISAPIERRTTPGLFCVHVLTFKPHEALLIADWCRETGIQGKWHRPPEYREMPDYVKNLHHWVIYFNDLTKSQITYLALSVKGASSEG
jgi:hypothetical protein